MLEGASTYNVPSGFEGGALSDVNAPASGCLPGNLKPEIIRELNQEAPPQSLGACSMPPYTELSAVQIPLQDVRYPDSDVRLMRSDKCRHLPYKLIPGQWANQDVIAGYSDSVVAANLDLSP